MARRQANETTETTPSVDTETKPKTQSVEGRIKLLVAENPKKPNSQARERFALYRDGMTVQEFLAAGGKRIDINWDRKHGFIEVVSE